ncbi:MAG TPA: ATP-binding cassette domain-containing protein [Blastocatellia bacterium]
MSLSGQQLRSDQIPPLAGSGQDDSDVAIRIRDLKKNYGATQALKGIDLDIKRGEIFGLIGPDGAGKTSMFQVLGGVMEQTSGEATILGRPSKDARSYVGYLTQAFSLYLDLSVWENLRYVGDLRLVPKSDIEARGRRYLSLFDMERFGDRLAGRLSGGMKQKLALACALIAEPTVLLLDEPTTGVDPVSRREFWDTLATLSGEGMTIMIATPYLDEAERCSHIALIYEGMVHETGTPAEIRNSLGLTRLEIHSDNLRRALDALTGAPGIEDVQRFGDRLDLMVKDPAEAEASAREVLSKEGITLRDMRQGEPTLENAFVSTLRRLGGTVHTPEFPQKRQFRERSVDALAIGARDLSKRFGDFDAVKAVNIEVKYGEIYGLLGANGAGKTTTIKMLCGLLDPTSGDIELAGEKSLVRSSFVRQRIGYMSQKFSLYDDLTIKENLEFFAGVYRVPRSERAEKRAWVLDVAGLSGRDNMMTAALPGGWKQRVAFGAAVMHEPSVLFLDEPTSGVDPLARRAFWKIINSFADRGVAVLVTTHYLEEAEQCNRLGLMVAGELVAQGTPTEMKSHQSGHLIELIIDQPQAAANLLKTKMERWRVSLFGSRLHVVIEDDSQTGIRRLTEWLTGDGINVVKAYEQPFSLEDVFIGVVEQARKEGKAIEDE